MRKSTKLLRDYRVKYAGDLAARADGEDIYLIKPHGQTRKWSSDKVAYQCQLGLFQSSLDLSGLFDEPGIVHHYDRSVQVLNAHGTGVR